MIIGETVQLTATVTPSNATDKEITWSSSKQSVATVSTTGLVSAVAEGVSTITAAAGGKTGSCTITVSKGFIAVESIEIDNLELALVEGDEFTLKATVKPDDATDKTVTWSSSDSKIATVDDTGKVKAIKEGEANITAAAGEKTADCKLTVSAKKIDVTMVMLNKSFLSMIVGEEQTLVATIVPENATVQTVQWSTSDPGVATVEEGVVKAVKEGSAKIVAYVDGKTAECNVTVNYIPVESITLDKPTLTLYEGEDYALTATIAPENATYQDITWTSNDPKIATVEDGKVVAVKKGTATIKAEANGKSALCQVEVLSSIAEISLDKTEISLIVGDTETLTAIITPADATLREKITWGTSDENVATVDETGKVKAVKEGTATVWAQVEGKRAECRVSVDYVHVSSIDISQTEATLYIGEAITLSATLHPSNVTYNKIEWFSSNTDVITVSEVGRVTAVGKGTATVSAKSDGKEVKCTFTVLVPLASLSFDQSSLTLFNGATATLSVIKNPADATLRGEVTWNTSNSSVATVNNEGLVTAINKGSANITASVDGCTATCPVSVLASVTGISLNKTSATLNKGESLQLSYSVTPTGATLQGQVSWVSSAPSVASVDNQGNVKAVGAGTADITVTLEGFTATCKITVVIPVSSVSLNKTSIELVKGNSETLVATINPSDATDKTISWKSSNSNVATVDNNGKVLAKNGGTATITVTASGKTATCAVTVTVPVTAISLNQSSITVAQGNTYDLIATITPSDATNKTITWTSTKENIATVNQNGRVTAVSGGEAVIRAAIGDVYAECTVVVTVPVSSVSLNKSELAMVKGETYTLTATVNPDNATDKTVTWKSSNSSVATVENGTVTAKMSGVATITASSGGKSATCSVTVTTPVTSVSLDRSYVSLEEEQTTTLVATVSPNDADNKTVTWISSDASVAKVNSYGLVTALKEGQAIITASAGTLSASCTVNVSKKIIPVTSVTLSKTSLSMIKGEATTLTATVKPDDATDKSVSWSSSDATIASVDQNGKVTALAGGSVTIRAAAGEKYATCAVNITVPVSSVSLDQSTLSLIKGESATLTATVNPSDATNKTVSWSTSNSSVATVINGVVKAIGGGSATITVNASGKTAICAVTVTVPVSSISLDKSSVKLKQSETVQLSATVGPNDATDKTVTWTSSDMTIATVDASGLVKAIKEGTVVITAKAGTKTATCNVSVSNTTSGGGHEGTGSEIWD